MRLVVRTAVAATVAVLTIAYALSSLHCTEAVGQSCNDNSACAQDGSEKCKSGSCKCNAAYEHYEITAIPFLDYCKKCTFGRYKDSVGNFDCYPTRRCEPGHRYKHVSKNQDATCPACESGKYQAKVNHRDDNCYTWSTCAAGKYVKQSATTKRDRSCDACPAGKYTPRSNRLTCSDCPSGKYQDNSGRSSCKTSTTCDDGYFSISEPPTSDRICAKACSPGKYSTLQSLDTCILCEPGTYQDQSGQTGCKPCVDAYQPIAGQYSCITYNTCGAGTKFKAGSATADRTCEACEAGKFRASPSHKYTTCLSCPPGTFQPKSGQSGCLSCFECTIGYAEDTPCTPSTDRTCTDKDPPAIVLRRPDNNAVITNTYVVEATFAFEPPIFTATDAAAGAVTKTLPPNIDDIDTSTVRSDQMLTYKATDANMNTATRTITVVVVDTTGPAITFDPAVLQLEAGEEVMRSNFTVGVSIVDRVDGTLGINLLEYDDSDVNVNTLGMYEVVYTLSAPDSNNNEAPPTTRTAAVVDTLAPVITIGFGDRDVSEHNVVIHEAATEFIFPSQSAFDTFDTAVNGGDVRRNEEPTFSSVVDDGTQFTFTYTATDASDNTATVVYVIEVRDTMAPTITINGEHNITHEAGTEYVDAGATATDLLEDAIGRGVEVVVTNNVLSKPPSAPAVFTVEYDACDKADNCRLAIRTVHVLDRTAPVVTLYGAEEVHVPYATRYVEAGYSAQDVHDGNVTSQVVVSGADVIDVHVAGTYEIEYAVMDASGNTGVAVRTVVVEALMRPEQEDVVVELVLAGMPETIFGGVLQLERDLEEALNVEIVVVFNVKDGGMRKTAPGVSTSATVVEFGVRASDTLQWRDAKVFADDLAQQVAFVGDVRVLGASVAGSMSSSSSPSRGGSVAGPAAGGVAGLLLLVVVAAVVLRCRSRTAKSRLAAPGAEGAVTMNPTFEGGQVEPEEHVYQVPARLLATMPGSAKNTRRHTRWDPSFYDVGKSETQQQQQQQQQQQKPPPQHQPQPQQPLQPQRKQRKQHDGAENVRGTGERDEDNGNRTRPQSIHAWSSDLYDTHEGSEHALTFRVAVPTHSSTLASNASRDIRDAPVYDVVEVVHSRR
ncbi:hypothetical protein PTSG_02374 [Salpingoeca rosetta]|uniref:HYR domain-containing protein n=1 Tax=Salpingoeca rosetta (strain ATCC 50818 / BSB-021) TaxID=946362 RepID=F2U208_SALR5|nr:uncharacterized protein PTSG_02374 [Salpingoeca rosetta]EGD81660.1 hypothetical protein PTSG_02374 [Salpingoeca rosetta]|eukprot:XP_004996864.1 hypothetical protein PTSG_02374 [Salpingoeca rosetta]